MNTSFDDFLALPVQENAYMRHIIYEFNNYLSKFRTVSTSFKVRDRRIRKALEYLEQHYQDAFSLGEVAQRVGLTGRPLSHLMHRYLGFTFTEVVVNVRVAHVIEMIKNTDLSLQSIAYDCGFATARNFTRVFRKIVGMTPTDFRKLCDMGLLNEEDQMSPIEYFFLKNGYQLTGNELNHYRLLAAHPSRGSEEV